VTVSLLWLAVACAPAYPPPPQFIEPMPEVSPFGEHVPLITLTLWHAKELALTAEQMRKLDMLRADFQREAQVRAMELHRLEFEVQQLLSQEQVDLAQVEARIKKIEAVRSDLRLGRIRTVETAKGALTVEQLQRLQPLLRGGP
jgi:Spy/CpxP family protein refolding chaperone